jgi:hypothetical protein
VLALEIQTIQILDLVWSGRKRMLSIMRIPPEQCCSCEPPDAARRLALRVNLFYMDWIPARTFLVVSFCPSLIIMLNVMTGIEMGGYERTSALNQSFFWC